MHSVASFMDTVRSEGVISFACNWVLLVWFVMYIVLTTDLHITDFILFCKILSSHSLQGIKIYIFFFPQSFLPLTKDNFVKKITHHTALPQSVQSSKFHANWTQTKMPQTINVLRLYLRRSANKKFYFGSQFSKIVHNSKNFAIQPQKYFK